MCEETGPRHGGSRNQASAARYIRDALKRSGIAWPLLVDKNITVERAIDLPFLAFSLGRVAGGEGEYLDHRDSGTPMDMRVPVSECHFLGREQD